MNELLEKARQMTLELQAASRHWEPPADLAQAEVTMHELLQAVADIEWQIVQCRFRAGVTTTKEQP